MWALWPVPAMRAVCAVCCRWDMQALRAVCAPWTFMDCVHHVVCVGVFVYAVCALGSLRAVWVVSFCVKRENWVLCLQLGHIVMCLPCVLWALFWLCG